MLSPERSAASGARLSRTIIWVTVLVAAGLVGLLGVRLAQTILQNSGTPKPVPIPTVTVTNVARSSQPTTISILGTIAARYDIPVGVEGDAGRVAAIYVEAGDHVKQGQILARLNVSVLKPQVGSLAAALEQARAEAELAAAEYHRAVAVGSQGALSA